MVGRWTAGAALALASLSAVAACQAFLAFDEASAGADGGAVDLSGLEASADSAVGVVDSGPAADPMPGCFRCNMTPSRYCAVGQTCCYLKTDEENVCEWDRNACPAKSYPISCTTSGHCSAMGRIGEVCCGLPKAPYFDEFKCMPVTDCVAGWKRTCVSNQDCPDGGKCIEAAIFNTCE
ncbi:MAG: hypothetical protein IPG50_00570 [Myxococcales bacterium]|nr:hypothetical protein [Myxococcales bacterium]